MFNIIYLGKLEIDFFGSGALLELLSREELLDWFGNCLLSLSTFDMFTACQMLHHSPAAVVLILYLGYLYLVESALVLLPMRLFIQDWYWKGHLGFVRMQQKIAFFELLISLLCWVDLNINKKCCSLKKYFSVAYIIYTCVNCTVNLTITLWVLQKY